MSGPSSRERDNLYREPYCEGQQYASDSRYVDESDDAPQDLMTEQTGESPLTIGADIAPDRIVGPQEAGLGGGLDQAEEAQLGITDEELDEIARGDEP